MVARLRRVGKAAISRRHTDAPRRGLSSTVSAGCGRGKRASDRSSGIRTRLPLAGIGRGPRSNSARRHEQPWTRRPTPVRPSATDAAAAAPSAALRVSFMGASPLCPPFSAAAACRMKVGRFGGFSQATGIYRSCVPGGACHPTGRTPTWLARSARLRPSLRTTPRPRPRECPSPQRGVKPP